METQTNSHPLTRKPYSRVTTTQIREIKKLRAIGKTYADVTAITGVPRSTLSKLVMKGRLRRVMGTRRTRGPYKQKVTLAVSPTTDKLSASIRTILKLNIPDTVKLIAIDALITP